MQVGQYLGRHVLGAQVAVALAVFEAGTAAYCFHERLGNRAARRHRLKAGRPQGRVQLLAGGESDLVARGARGLRQGKQGIHVPEVARAGKEDSHTAPR
ncbi:hypothetical protein HEP87_64120 [Streptomyces sp. S1D4-11]